MAIVLSCILQVRSQQSSNNNKLTVHEMKYDILTDTAFFRAAQDGCLDDMTANYGEFIEKVVDVCGCANGKPSAFATLSYTEIELKALLGGKSKGSAMIEKAVSLVADMQQMIGQMPLAEMKPVGKKEAQLKWTGDIVNLVELVYGLVEMGCVNDGNVPIEKLGNALFGLFGLEPKPYSRAYTTIKRRVRENGGRTYFLTEMRKMLEERIDQDIHLYLRK